MSTPAVRRRRRRVVLLTVACGLAAMAGCLAVNALFHSPVEWFWVAAVPVYVTALIGAFLWIRLTPSG